MAFGKCQEVADGVGHFGPAEVGTAAEVGDLLSVLVDDLRLKHLTRCYLLHVDVLCLVAGTAVLVGEVGTDEVIVLVLRAATLGGVKFEVDVTVLLFGLIDEVESRQVVARVLQFISCHWLIQ